MSPISVISAGDCLHRRRRQVLFHLLLSLEWIAPAWSAPLRSHSALHWLMKLRLPATAAAAPRHLTHFSISDIWQLVMRHRKYNTYYMGCTLYIVQLHCTYQLSSTYDLCTIYKYLVYILYLHSSGSYAIWGYVFGSIQLVFITLVIFRLWTLFA